jgi:hypothetical protein
MVLTFSQTPRLLLLLVQLLVLGISPCAVAAVLPVSSVPGAKAGGGGIIILSSVDSPPS